MFAVEDDGPDECGAATRVETRCPCVLALKQTCYMAPQPRRATRHLSPPLHFQGGLPCEGPAPFYYRSIGHQTVGCCWLILVLSSYSSIFHLVLSSSILHPHIDTDTLVPLHARL